MYSNAHRIYEYTPYWGTKGEEKGHFILRYIRLKPVWTKQIYLGNFFVCDTYITRCDVGVSTEAQEGFGYENGKMPEATMSLSNVTSGVVNGISEEL